MDYDDDIIDKKVIKRAEAVIACMPFKRLFYLEVLDRGMSALDLVNRTDWNRLVFAPFGKSRAEAHFLWLIKNGILRWEVDGQGLTSKVRLTALGHRVISGYLGDEVRRASLREKLIENFRRHSKKYFY